MKSLFTFFIATILLHSCDLLEDPANNDLFCTEEFRTIAVTITGGTLDDFYTIRQSTEDTIRFSIENSPSPNVYPILDDGFQSTIANSQEGFDFNGVVNEIVVIDEEYVISADGCHISLVSGKTEIAL